jgi:outer membrane receptor for ferrienterochelin and colicins
MSALVRAFVRVRAMLLVVVLVAWPARARADEPAADTSDLEGLLNENVVSTASKSAEVGATAPATVTTVTAEDLRRYGIRTLAEAIDFLSLGAVTSDSQHTIDIGARGVLIPNDNGDHMLLLVNGHTQNEPLFGRAHFGRGAAIPIEMIDHIEVILGPGSVLYGSNAMLGVINVVTKQAKDWSGVHAVAEVEPGKSWRGLVGAGATFQTPLAKSPLDLTLGVEYYQHDGPTFAYDYRYGGIDGASARPFRYERGGPENGFWGGLARDAYYTRLPSGFARVVLGDFELNAGVSSFKRAAPYRSRFTKSFMDFDDPDSFERDRRVWADLTHRATLSAIARLTTRAYVDGWDWYSELNASSRAACLFSGDLSASTCTLSPRGRSRWVGAEPRLVLDWLQNERLVTTLGVDGRLREMKSKVDFTELGTGRALQSSTGLIDRNDTLIGAYAQQTILPTRWLSLNLGARLDKETRFDAVLSPRFAIAVSTWQGATFKTSYAEAFRSPSFVETDYRSVIQLSPGALEPERVRSVEGSFEQKIGANRLLFGAFRSWWQDMVENHVLTTTELGEAVATGEATFGSFGVSRFRNVSRIDNYGLNATYEGRLGAARRFHYGTNVTAAVARRDEEGQPRLPLAVAPQMFGNARIAYELPTGWPTLALSGHYLARRPIDRAYDSNWPPEGTYAPPQLELRAAVTGPVPFVKGLSYRFTANYGFADRGPYVVGAEQVFEGLNQRSPQLLPLDRFRTGILLQYDLFQ